MDIAPSSLAGQEMALNRAQVGSDILQKTIQKTEEGKQAAQAAQPAQTPRVNIAGSSQLDVYA